MQTHYPRFRLKLRRINSAASYWAEDVHTLASESFQVSSIFYLSHTDDILAIPS